MRVQTLWSAVSLTRVAAGGAELEDVLRAGGEGAFGDVDFLAVEVGDDAGRQVDHLVDAPPDAAGREHAGVAGDAGVEALIRPDLRAGVPLVDRVVVLHAGVGAAPGGEGDLVPQVAGLERLGDLAVGAVGEVQSPSSSTALKKLLGMRTELLEFCPVTVIVGFAVEVVVELEAELLGQLLLVLGRGASCLRPARRPSALRALSS